MIAGHGQEEADDGPLFVLDDDPFASVEALDTEGNNGRANFALIVIHVFLKQLDVAVFVYGIATGDVNKERETWNTDSARWWRNT